MGFSQQVLNNIDAFARHAAEAHLQSAEDPGPFPPVTLANLTQKATELAASWGLTPEDGADAAIEIYGRARELVVLGQLNQQIEDLATGFEGAPPDIHPIKMAGAAMGVRRIGRLITNMGGRAAVGRPEVTQGVLRELLAQGRATPAAPATAVPAGGRVRGPAPGPAPDKKAT